MQAKSSRLSCGSSKSLWRVTFRTKFSYIPMLDLIFEEIAEIISVNEIKSAHIDHLPDDLWEYKCFFVNKPDEEEIRNITQNFDIKSFEIAKEENKDWVIEVQNNMKPIEVGRFFIFHKIDEINNFAKISTHNSKLLPIYINPGMAFGTGDHPTTYLCLEFISENLLDPSMIIDIGCGTGILSFAAKKIWQEAKVIGIDIDKIAIDAANENKLVNNMDVNFDISIDDNQYEGAVDLIISNILAGPIIDMRNRFWS
ncbi:MAG: 50S ribosomal protein L11 methyltransferase, partial [Rickettsiaceae bacterium]|nr:50S ribosomal protein L11 methyltransferase [Rickettsiaceae bacterium]